MIGQKERRVAGSGEPGVIKYGRTRSLRSLLLGDRFRIGLVRSSLIYLLLALSASIFLLPFYWMLNTALKPVEQVFTVPPTYFPSPVQWENFPASMQATAGEVSAGAATVSRYFLNTTLITVNGVIGTVISSSLAAYAFSRLSFPGRNILFMGVLSTLMIPFAVIMVPQFMIWRHLGWLNTFWPLMIPQWGGSAWNIFLLRQFFMTIPKEYDEAALIDGASAFTIYSRVIMPLAKPALAAVAVFAFVFFWNDFLGPLIILTTPRNFTLTLFLANFRVAYATLTPWNLYMAAALIVVAPCLIVFFFSQDVFLKGITIADIKR